MQRPLRVLFLTQYYPPEIGAPQTRIQEFASLLKARGYAVEILTAMPNYPKGELFEGYRGRLWMKEEVEGIPVRRTWIYATNSLRFAKRLTNYFSFVFSSMMVGPFLVKRPDVIVVQSPPLFIGISAIVLRYLLRAPMIFNVSDLWPDGVIRLGAVTSRPLIAFALRLERLCYRLAAAKTGPSLGIIRGIREKDPEGRIALVPNGCDCALFTPAKRDRTEIERLGWGDKIVVGYAGLVGLPQGVEILVEAADLLRDRTDIRFLVVGDGAERERVVAAASARKLDNIVFLGARAKQDMPGMVAGFDMTVVPLRSFLPGALPSKIYEAMASEVPIVLAAAGDAEDLVRRAESGIAVDYDAPPTVAKAICRLADDPEERHRLGRNGRAYALAYHHRPAIANSLARLIEAVVADDRRFFETDPICRQA